MHTIKTSEQINRNRRRFFGTAALTIAAAQLALSGPGSAGKKIRAYAILLTAAAGCTLSPLVGHAKLLGR
jgi:nitrous oxide reductase